MVIYLSLLVSICGCLMYALCVNPKLSEIGRMMCWVGLLAFLLRVVAPAISVMR